MYIFIKNEKKMNKKKLIRVQEIVSSTPVANSERQINLQVYTTTHIG